MDVVFARPTSYHYASLARWMKGARTRPAHVAVALRASASSSQSRFQKPDVRDASDADRLAHTSAEGTAVCLRALRKRHPLPKKRAISDRHRISPAKRTLPLAKMRVQMVPKALHRVVPKIIVTLKVRVAGLASTSA